MKRVKVIYRNYIPLYSAYCSFWLTKLAGYEIEIPPVNKRLGSLFKIYRKIAKFPLVDKLVHLIQKVIFPSAKSDSNPPDILFYTGIIPDPKVTIPHVIDFEHVFALFNYAQPNEVMSKMVLDSLLNPNCKAILPWSIAAEETLLKFYPTESQELKLKSQVLYPGLPNYTELYEDNGNFPAKYVKENDKLKLLFVGKDYKRKGLIEVLEALRRIDKGSYDFYCISNMSESEQKEYDDISVSFLPANFDHEELIRQFFMHCDLFIMPTHEDTFGMVFLEALSAGLPVITTKQFATPEFITDGFNGFFVDSDELFLEKSIIPDIKNNGTTYDKVEEKMVDSIRSLLVRLIDNRSLLDGMRDNTQLEFKEGGKFSISKRNQQLLEIFESTLNEV